MTQEKHIRRIYTEEFKRDAVALVTEQGYRVTEAARSLGVHHSLLRKWRRNLAAAAYDDGLSVSERNDATRLCTWWWCWICVRVAWWVMDRRIGKAIHALTKAVNLRRPPLGLWMPPTAHRQAGVRHGSAQAGRFVGAAGFEPASSAV